MLRENRAMRDDAEMNFVQFLSPITTRAVESRLYFSTRSYFIHNVNVNINFCYIISIIVIHFITLFPLFYIGILYRNFIVDVKKIHSKIMYPYKRISLLSPRCI